MFLKTPAMIRTCSHIKNEDKQAISIPLAISPASRVRLRDKFYITFAADKMCKAEISF